MLVAILLCFIIAVLASRVVAIFGATVAAWVLALLPLGLFIKFITLIPLIARGGQAISTTPFWPAYGIDFTFYADGLSNLFALLISGIGILIVIYSGAYLAKRPDLGRFYRYLFFFMGSMLGLVLSDNLIMLFIFWELTTLSSFLLIGFDNHKAVARAAALQGLLVTALGGLALLAGFLLIRWCSGTFLFSQMLHTFSLQFNPFYLAIVILVLIGAFTKSAQFPSHFWLPNAMAAPTPVSAYLHSATMVQAGVYLVARMTPILGHTQLWFWLLTTFGSLTMVVTAMLALRSDDMKRMLAYSTTMALGLLMFLLATDQPAMVQAAILFFFAHALYKAGLFLAVGNIDHAAGSRNLSEVSGLGRALPWTLLGMAICAASMAGLPPLVGFISKEAVYEAKLAGGTGEEILIFIVILTNVIFAVISGLVIFKPFCGQRRVKQQPHEAPRGQWLAVMVLALASLAFGLLPYSIDGRIITPAVQAVVSRAKGVELSLWHGVGIELLLTIVTLVIAVVVYFLYGRISRILRWFARYDRFGAEAGYDLVLKIIEQVAQLSHWLQSGYLSRYIAITLLAPALTVIVLLIYLQHWPIAHFVPHGLSWFDWLVAALVFAAALAVTITRHYIAAITYLSMVGIGSTLIFLRYGAPDVAMTQILVDTLTIIIVVLALYRLPRLPQMFEIPRWVAWRNGVIAIVVGLLVTLLMLAVITVPFSRFITLFYGRNAYVLAHGRNIVNVILVDFRAFDTLGEILVVALSAIGVYGLLKSRQLRKRRH